MPLTETQIAKLERLRFHATRYEIELTTAAGAKWLVAYTPRRNFRGPLAAVQQRGSAILRVAGMPDDATVTRDGASLRFGDGSVIRFSGRTQRDAISNGELPYVGA